MRKGLIEVLSIIFIILFAAFLYYTSNISNDLHVMAKKINFEATFNNVIE